MSGQYIRNFTLVAHIDHGKSTLADRMLEVTGTVSRRDLKEQTLDQMDIERERGITIKLAPVRMRWHPNRTPDTGHLTPDRGSQMSNVRGQVSSAAYTLHLIDTPGHVDFTYEVSRSLAAVEGAVLLVDATQGVQAQTIANLYLALGEDLTIIPAVNKIDLPNADVERTRAELVQLLGCAPDEVLLVSGKTGEGVPALLDAIVERVPAPAASAKLQATSSALRALIFDSIYDDYRGVIAYVRVVDGAVAKGDRLRLMAGAKDIDALEVGTFSPKLTPLPSLAAGEIGYIVTGLKDIRVVRVGDTVTNRDHPANRSLPGYTEVKPMVYAGIFPKRADDTEELRDGIERLRLNDASLTFEPERSAALGVGFRCGFLGLLHLEVFQERLRREHGVEAVVTVPSVAYHVRRQASGVSDQRELFIRSPQELPDPSTIESVEEPWARLDIVTPETYVGPLMQLCQEKRGVYVTTEYLSAGKPPVSQRAPSATTRASAQPEPYHQRFADALTDNGPRQGARIILRYELPLSAVLVDFYDRLKSASQGYASMNYELVGYRSANVRRLDILVAGEPVEALSSIVYEDEAMSVGRRIVEHLKGVIPRQQFEVRIQAVLGGKIVASERIAPLRKDVTAKLYGGDVTRKMKLLEKQKKGKKQMRAGGHVDLPPEVYVSVLRH